MNTNPKIKIQKLKISESPYSQTQQYHQILKPNSNKSIHKYNTTNPNKKISNSKSLSHLSFAYRFLSSPSLRPCFFKSNITLSQTVQIGNDFFFFNLSNRWWWVCSLVVFFPPIFEMGLVIGMLNRCGFELVVGY